MLVLKHLAPQLGRRLMMLRWCSLACGAVSRLYPAATGLWFSFRRCASSFRGSFRFVDSTRETGRKRSRPHSRLPGVRGKSSGRTTPVTTYSWAKKKHVHRPGESLFFAAQHIETTPCETTACFFLHTFLYIG